MTLVGRTLIASVLLLASQARAESPSWYFGAGITGVRAPSVQDNLCNEFTAVGFAVDCEETSLAGKGFVGSRINQYFSVEGTLAYLGQFKATATAPGLTITGQATGYSGMLEALGTLPVVEGLDLYVRGGAAFWYVDVDVSVPGACSSCYSQSATGVSPTAGLGLQWWFAHNLSGPGSLALRLEYQQIWNVGDENKTGQTDLQMLTLGFLWRF